MLSRFMLMLTLILAGEVVYMLPFGLTRFFRPSLLEAFSITNTQLGDVFAVYGVLAMIAYFPGGALADRFSARFLLSVSLIATGLGGLYLATYPGIFGLALLFGYWGITTILLFWSALLRATREWGGDDAQGRAFGILEGGRGVVAVLLATAGVAMFAIFMPDDVVAVSDEGRRAALREVILLYSGTTIATGVLAWFVIPRAKHIGDTGRSLFKGAVAVLNRPLVWAQAGIIICAYCGYKGLDNYSLYAVQVLGMNEVEGAKLAAIGVYIRPFAAVAAGLLADRWSAAGTLRVAFAVSLVSYVALALASPDGALLFVIYGNLFLSFFAVFALRGVYFALLQENHVPPFLTGAVAGTVSFVGYTPEIFFGPITGRILDANPGAVGFQHYFLFLAVCSAIGIAVVGYLLRLQRSGSEGRWPTESMLMRITTTK
ncbi:MAG: MFS transporter [Gammaproteobacteria bacterium]|nr:MFS transporter [Gammaproteobacteria bacterium]